MSTQHWVRRLRRIGIWALLGLAVYFGSVQVQSWMGRRALASMGIESHTLEDAFSQASTQNKLVLADLSAIWCSTCRRLHSDVLADPRVKDEIRRNYVFARIEYESKEGEQFRERYGVRGFPSLLVLDADGQVVRRLPVVFDPERFLATLRSGVGQGSRAES
jgi:thiol:disulfide interchange protein